MDIQLPIADQRLQSKTVARRQEIMKFCLLAAFLATLSAAYAANKECCLCDECGPVAAEKVELFTVSPFPDQPESGATCEDIAMGLLEYNEDSDMCTSVHMDFHEACCTDHFGTLKIWKKDILVSARAHVRSLTFVNL